MATGKSYFSKPSYRFLSGGERDSSIKTEPMFEFDETDMWNSNHQVISSPELKKSIKGSRVSKRSSKVVPNGDRSNGTGTGTASSLPVNIPDWSKILREDRRDNNNYQRRKNDEDSDSEDGGGDGRSCRVPPHEFLAKQFERTRIASFSVHEGVGRTLKGRDLSRVRDAIWEKTGFED